MDLEVIETGNGGDFFKKTKDLSVIEGFESMPYICMFGGNLAASTPTTRIPTEQAFDFWGNSLLFPNDPDIQFNSETERVLMTVPVNSAGRVLLEQAIKKDLQPMKKFCQIAVVVSILSDDKIGFGIALRKPSNLQQKEFIYIWDATRRELLEREIAKKSGKVSDFRYFDPSFDLSFE